MPNFILIHPAVWPQYTNVTDRTRQRSDSINRFTNSRPKIGEHLVKLQLDYLMLSVSAGHHST